MTDPRENLHSDQAYISVHIRRIGSNIKWGAGWTDSFWLLINPFDCNYVKSLLCQSVQNELSKNKVCCMFGYFLV